MRLIGGLKCISVLFFQGRAANSDADRLAKFAQSSDEGRHVWFGVPHDLRCITHNVDFHE